MDVILGIRDQVMMFIGQHDATCMYVIFALQCCIVFLGFPVLISACSSTQKRLNLSYGRWMAKWMIIAYVGKWMIETYDIFEAQYTRDTDPNHVPEEFNPYKLLHLKEESGFQTDEIEKAYDRLSVKYDPRNVPKSVPQWKAVRRYKRLIRAYETLTKDDMFYNYQMFGNPDGGLTTRAMFLAVPTWILEDDFRPFLITWIFITVVAALLGLRVM